MNDSNDGTIEIPVHDVDFDEIGSRATYGNDSPVYVSHDRHP